jgi:aminoglycoside N3'-acetyltransferase
MRRRALALLLAEVRALRLRVKRLLRRAGAHRPDYYRDALLHRVSARQLEAFFRRLGLREGMLVYLQSSYGGIGHFSGGPRGLLEILCRIVGPEGTLVLPSFPTSTSMFDYAAAAPVFDVARTPSRIGLLPEVFRTMPGVLRSLHPTHPVCAWGARAGEIVADHELCATPQQPGSPFGKMVAGGGHILRIGTRANPLTHTMQEMAEWPNLFVPGAPATLDCIDREGRRVQVTTRIYRPGLPYVLFLEDPVTGAPLRANIMHFP